VNEFPDSSRPDRLQNEAPPATRSARIPAEQVAFERSRQKAARVFLIAVAVMMVIAGVIVYVLLQSRPAGLG
jgi:hypothetical protein